MKENRDAGRKPRRCLPGECSQDHPVSSRRMRAGVAAKAVSLEPAGPILLTGEPGTGKTWLCGAWFTSLRADGPGFGGDVRGAGSAGLPAADRRGAGSEAGERIGCARVALARVIEDDLSDGRSWILVLENAQHILQPVWNEVQGLVTRDGSVARVRGDDPDRSVRAGEAARGRPMSSGGLADLVPCASPAAGPRRGLRAGRIARGSRARGPGRPGRGPSPGIGQPRRLLQVMRRRLRQAVAPALASIGSAPSKRRSRPCPGRSIVAPVFQPALTSAPSRDRATEGAESESEFRSDEADAMGTEVAMTMVPSRPPIRVEEGLIEVGWEGSLAG